MIRYTYAPLQSEDELEALSKILSNSFGGKPQDLRERVPIVGRENIRILKDAGEVIGGLWQIPMGQFFSGRSIPMSGVAAVGIQPQSRGRGSAHTLMSECVREFHRQGIPLSTLYPATNRLYRGSGYALAGSLCEMEINAKRLPHLERSLDVIPLSRKTHHREIERVYRTFAKNRDGYLDRGTYIWERIYNPRHFAAEAYGVMMDKTLSAYIMIAQKPAARSYDLLVTDFAYTHPLAGERMLTLLAQHKTMAGQAWMFGGMNHPAASLFPEHLYDLKLQSYWMLRLTHVAEALSQRAYPPGMETTLHLDIADDIIPENSGLLSLSISNGQGTVTPGGSGDIKIDVRELATLYSGFMSAKQLTLDQRIQGSTPAICTLNAAFPVGAPAMGEMF